MLQLLEQLWNTGRPTIRDGRFFLLEESPFLRVWQHFLTPEAGLRALTIENRRDFS
jgi:hypothetical protein